MSLKFVLDSDVFIRSHQDHYSFDFCPGFWDAIAAAHLSGLITSILPVKDELLKGDDILCQWAKVQPDTFFPPTDDPDVIEAFKKVAEYVNGHQQYQSGGKAKFLGGADPFLIAFSMINSCEIITHEASAPLSQSKVKLPDIASHFGIECHRPYKMIREISARFCLETDESDLF